MRFGHLSAMESTIKAGAAYGIPKDMTLLKKPSGDSCIDCIKDKQKRKSHQAADKKTKPRRIFKPGEKIHIDTKKFEVTGIGNYTYWLSIVESRNWMPYKRTHSDRNFRHSGSKTKVVATQNWQRTSGDSM